MIIEIKRLGKFLDHKTSVSQEYNLAIGYKSQCRGGAVYIK